MSCIRVIFNPTAAGGRAARLGPALRDRLNDGARNAGLELDWTETQGAEHAITLAQEAATNGCELVVAVGGDGTVNEAVNGLMQAGVDDHATTLGVIPTGSGNDFAWLAGIPLDPIAACQRLFDGEARAVDVGHIREAGGRERYFDNGCGVGFDAQVGLEVRNLKWLRGFLIYLVGVLKTLILHHQAPPLRMRLDEREITRPTMMLTIGNGSRHGGGFFVTPHAQLDDGWFDVCIAGEFSRLGMLLIIPRFIKGTHTSHHQIEMTRARRIVVESPTPQPIHLDGEIFATDARNFEVRIILGALRVRV